MTKPKRVQIANDVWHKAESAYAPNTRNNAVHYLVSDRIEGVVGTAIYSEVGEVVQAVLERRLY